AGYTGLRPRDEKFASVKPITVAGKSGTLYVAGDAREPTTDEVMAQAQARVGRSRDPIGDALEAGPETRHVAIIRVGDKELIVSVVPSYVPTTGCHAFIVTGTRGVNRFEPPAARSM